MSDIAQTIPPPRNTVTLRGVTIPVDDLLVSGITGGTATIQGELSSADISRQRAFREMIIAARLKK